MRKKDAGEPYDEDAWGKVARTITRPRLYAGTCSRARSIMSCSLMKKAGQAAILLRSLTMGGRENNAIVRTSGRNEEVSVRSKT